MATTVGKLPEFHPNDGHFEVYLERFEVFATANDIAEGKKLPAFSTAIGDKAYVTLRSLLLPKTPAKASFTEVVDVLTKHYAPKHFLVTKRVAIPLEAEMLDTKEMLQSNARGAPSEMEDIH
ncbi:hypothetical protein HPB49_002857 [Dermacentor silvarum]|uniref:Uncharacterized protein n=1 Tax=Dermacentor silvarum TaxID=543639 RepID=A0ACB8CJF4_DERSI|nr:hypothetical protein HPB49_002857 [Dermacentor silvarum]